MASLAAEERQRLKDWRSRPVKRNTERYEREVCEVVNLPHPGSIDWKTGKDAAGVTHCFLGWLTPADSEKIVDQITRLRLKSLRRQLEHLEAEHGSALDGIAEQRHIGRSYVEHQLLGGDYQDHYDVVTVRNQIEERQFYTFSQYQKAATSGRPRQAGHKSVDIQVSTFGPMTSHVKTVTSRAVEGWEVKEDSEAGITSLRITEYLTPADRRFAALLRETPHALEDFTPDIEGYVNYLELADPPLAAMLKRPLPVYLPEYRLQRHVHCTGGSGSGKSELLKLLLHGIVTAHPPNSSVVLIEPHGDLCEQIAHWATFAGNDRLTYIDPYLFEGRTVTLNPFETAPGADIDVRGQQLLDMFEEMLTGEGGADLTVNMRRILGPSIRVLLEKADATLVDLLHLMQEDERASPLIQLGRNSTHDLTREFFTHEFHDGRYSSTKASIGVKVASIINSKAEERLFVGPTTVKLEDLVDGHKVIILKFPKGEVGSTAANAFGRFTVAQLQAMAMRRAKVQKENRSTVYVVLDEAQNYLSRSAEIILNEARKYNVFLVAAHQQVTSLRREILSALLSNAKLKIAGSNAHPETRNFFASATNTPPDVVARTKDREFLMRVGDGEVFKLKAASHLADFSPELSMTHAQWEAVKKKQLAAGYYRPIDAPRSMETPPPTPSKREDKGDWKPKYDGPDWSPKYPT